MVINNQVPIVTDLHPFATHRHHAFDVELVLSQTFDTFGSKHDNLAAFGRHEVVTEPIDKKMIPGDNPQVHNGIAFMKELPVEAGAHFERLLPVIRREPDEISLIA